MNSPASTTCALNAAFQPRRFTSYDHDGNQSDDATHRRFNRFHSRFDQPDPQAHARCYFLRPF